MLQHDDLVMAGHCCGPCRTGQLGHRARCTNQIHDSCKLTPLKKAAAAVAPAAPAMKQRKAMKASEAAEMTGPPHHASASRGFEHRIKGKMVANRLNVLDKEEDT